MRYTFRAKNTTVTDALKEKAENKINKLRNLFPENTNITITFSVVKLDHKVEVTVVLPKRVLRAEVVSHDMYIAIDDVIDKLEKQMLKYKSCLRDKSRKNSIYTDELNAFITDTNDDLTDNAIEINRTKKFAVKPMDAEEAVMEMELISHNFFVFRNSTNNEINVVYKRADGSYGLIDPEY